MKLKTTPPPTMIALLERSGASPSDIQLSVSTDINLLGQYEPQWLIVTSNTLWVIDSKTPDDPGLKLAMNECDEFRTIGVVGSGLLQVKIQGMWLDMVRYSNRMKYHFGRVAKRLEQLRSGETFTLNETDEYDPRRCRSCGLMLDFEGETCPRCINRGRAITRVLRLMRPYAGATVLMLALLVASLTLAMVNPKLTGFMVDGVLRENPRTSHLPHWLTYLAENFGASQKLMFIVATVALVAILQAVISIINGRVGSRVGTAITYDMRSRLVEHLQKLGLSYYDKQSVGSLVGRVAYDTEAVQGVVAQFTGGFIMQILMVVFSAVFMFSLAPELTLWTLLPAPFVAAGSYLYYRLVYPHHEKLWDRSSKQAAMLSGLLSGIRVVKAFAQEDREAARFQKSSGALRDARRRVDMKTSTFSPVMGLVFSMGGWLVWYVGGQEVLHNNVTPAEGMTLGDLMTFFGYMGMFYGPLASLTNLTSWASNVATQVHRIFEVLDTPISIPDSDKPVRIAAIEGEIEFKNVIFGYNRQNPILKNVSFHIKAGENIGVVGHSGSGKTTVINLISRFYDIDEGELLIDGVDIRKISQQDLRQQIGVVLQEPFLFRGTIWENLVYGRTDAPIDQVLAASKAGNAHDFILKQVYGYDTWVGERGAGISGGERQRLSIARALLCEPRILILDEATSSVDSESELAIQGALAELVKGRTSIIIAHRLSTLRNSDRIMVFDDGKLVEQGSHDELMRVNGKYAKLVRIQTSVNKSASLDDLKAHEEQQKVEVQREQMTDTVIDPDTGLAPITSHHARWLTPQNAAIHLGNHGALHVTVINERIYNGVWALRTMPVRYSSQYLSLRWFNAENREQEIGLIRDLSQWPAVAQKLVRESLLRRYFVHTILGIQSIKHKHNYLHFEVTTDLGAMSFIMRWSSSAAVDYGNTGKVLTDMEDNRYVIPAVETLPAAERNIFERYIYW